ncbi:hypothetical protein [Spirosoma aerolatum]|uniref:hypothetical protein n=1 Tax=Spirosoma aerolatum TaxID=1211326 RepID=UPI0009AF14DE|nr:hypothetical protein [Spirosoma aerolatum]
MKRLFIGLMLVNLVTMSCRKNDAIGVGPYTTTIACGALNPAQNLPWLRSLISQFKADIVRAATYKGETYIDLYAYHWSCMGCHIYRCDGSSVDLSQLPSADREEIMSRLWSPEPYVLYKRSL